MQSRCCWPPESASALVFSRSLTSSQSAAPRSARSTRSSIVPVQAEHLRREGDVVVDRLRERVRLLEHHADPPPHLDRVDVARRRGPRRGRGSARRPCARDEVVHPVEAADERALAAAGRADHRGDQVAVDVEADAREREVRAVGDAEVVDPEDDFAASRPGASSASARGDVDRGHVGGHVGESRARCSGPGLEDVNIWCRAGERGSRSRRLRLLKLARAWTRRPPSDPRRDSLASRRSLPRPHRRHRAPVGLDRAAAARRARPDRPDRLQGRRRRMAGDQRVRALVRLGPDAGTRSPTSLGALDFIFGTLQSPRCCPPVAAPICDRDRALPERARAGRRPRRGRARWSRCSRPSRASSSGSGASSCSARSCRRRSARASNAVLGWTPFFAARTDHGRHMFTGDDRADDHDHPDHRGDQPRAVPAPSRRTSRRARSGSA